MCEKYVSCFLINVFWKLVILVVTWRDGVSTTTILATCYYEFMEV